LYIENDLSTSTEVIGAELKNNFESIVYTHCEYILMYR